MINVNQPFLGTLLTTCHVNAFFFHSYNLVYKFQPYLFLVLACTHLENPWRFCAKPWIPYMWSWHQGLPCENTFPRSHFHCQGPDTKRRFPRCTLGPAVRYASPKGQIWKKLLHFTVQRKVGNISHQDTWHAQDWDPGGRNTAGESPRPDHSQRMVTTNNLSVQYHQRWDWCFILNLWQNTCIKNIYFLSPSK